jgi:intracellular sulfur oxidation DsrE/DsrF family protein
MQSMSRRSFVGQAAAGLAMMATPAISAADERLYKPSDWQMSSFDRLLKQHYDAKQVYDITEIDDGNAFDHIVNSFNGLHYGFGIPNDHLKIVAALRSKATVFNYSDSLWEKYHIGELLKINDPKTGKPLTRNIFYASSAGNPPKYSSQNPNDDASAEEDTSIQALQARGLQLLACHMALHGQSGFIAKKLKLKQEDVLQDLQTHLLPGVIIVPSMVSAICMLQNKGHFSYIRM